MFKRAAAVLALMSLPLLAAAADFVAGKDYFVLPRPGAVEMPGKVEVREFFWYGCPHCFRLDPFLQAWLEKKPADVVFVRTPAALNASWEVNARGFYVAKTLGLEEQTHRAMFAAIHVQKLELSDSQSVGQFYGRYGVTLARFNELYDSPAVNAAISKSNALSRQYHLDGVPAVVVDGKYLIKGEGQSVVDVLKYLVAREEAGLPRPAPKAGPHKTPRKKHH